MIITTSQERNLVDCCACQLPECDPPRKECESVALCGYALPDIEGITDLQRVTRYRSIEVEKVKSYASGTYSFRDGSYKPEVEGTFDSTERCSRDATTVSGSCDEEEVSTYYNGVNDYKEYGYDGTLIGEAVTTQHSESGPGACAGTEQVVGTGIFGSSGPSTWNVCSCVAVSAMPGGTTDFTLSGTVLTRTASLGVDSMPDWFWTDDYTQTITFSSPINADLEALAFDDADAIHGTACSPFVTYGGGAVDAIGTIGKARYRFGVPAGYSTAEVPRSYYEAQWDEVFFPTTGDPVLIASQSWLWGGDMGAPWSDWFELPLLTAPGEIRVVNLLIKCYKSARLGVKPTSVGEVYVFPA